MIGTERHESRRIDDQLRGRSGRQGDVGISTFYLSLEDDLMKRFGSERIQGMMEKLGMQDEMLESKFITRNVESAQKRVEGNNFDARKRVLEYDEVLRTQREIIYGERNEIIDKQDVRDLLHGMIDNSIERTVSYYNDNPEMTDYETFKELLEQYYVQEDDISLDDLEGHSTEEIITLVKEKAYEELDRKEEILTSERMRQFERMMMLRTIDQKWTEHIDSMDQLRTGIHLRSVSYTHLTLPTILLV